MSDYDEIKSLSANDTRELASVIYPGDSTRSTHLSTLKSQIWSTLREITKEQIIDLRNELFGKQYDKVGLPLYTDVIKRLRRRGYKGPVQYNKMKSFIERRKTKQSEKEAIDDLMNMPFQPPIPKPIPARPHIPFAEYEKRKNYFNILKSRRSPKNRGIPDEYRKIIAEAEKQELLDYVKANEDTRFEELDDNHLLINIPQDYEKAESELIKEQRYRCNRNGSFVWVTDKEKPIVTYYLNDVCSLDSIKQFLERVCEKELKPLKINFDLSGIFEEHFTVDDQPEVKYVARSIVRIGVSKYHQNPNIPIIIEKPEDIDTVMHYIEIVLHNYSVTESSTKLIFVSTVAFKVHRLRKTTGKIINLPRTFTTSKAIIVDNEDDNLCWYRFLAICLNNNLTDANKYRVKDRTQFARKLLCKEHGYEYTKRPTKAAQKLLSEFGGMTEEKMKESAQKYNINVIIYDYNVETNKYNISDRWIFNEEWPTHNALLYADEQIIHIMYVTKPERLTGFYVCPKCRQHCIGVDWWHATQKMNAHIESCKGKPRKEFIPEKESKPYCPHILGNPVYEYCFAHNLPYKPQEYYITYDFETMERQIGKNSGKSTIVDSELVPLSVACCVKSSTGRETKHWDVREPNFIEKWIEYMFVAAKRITEDKRAYYSTLLQTKDLPKFVHRDLYTVSVLGYNSARFDSNLFKQYLNTKNWHIDNMSLIGTTSSMKQMIITNGNIKLRFIDAMAFVAGGDLKQFAKDFGGVAYTDKGIFPYDAVTADNYNDVLSKSEPFPYSAFYSNLKKKYLIDEKQYEEYVTDSKRFNDRWDYLLAYNDNDVEMMIKPIDNLIKLNGEYNVDLLSNLSVSKNAACIKYALAYKDFDPNCDYDTINKKNTFTPTKQWWNTKCASYYKQDGDYNNSHPKKTQRDLSLTVSENDFDKFLQMYNDPVNGKCHLCGEHFTFANKPTLDRIDNNKGHAIDNCKLACKICNSFRSNNDPLVTRLRIQLKKFCLLRGLPMTLDKEEEYNDLRKAITGGLAIVMHRCNIKDKSVINRFYYEDNSFKSVDTDNVITHVFGIDFNSLYPSSFSSNYHEFNPYHGGIMYMPGRLLYRCTDVTRCRQIINENKFTSNPKTVFHATVKLECPKSKYNELINFPPVFRNFDIVNDETTIGTYMYDYGKKNNIHSIDKQDTKLTMALDTMGEFRTFNCYYLWFLLDLGLTIADVKSVSVYSAHTAFNGFVNTFMQRRQDILAGIANGNEKFYKLNMNGSYGYDGMNTEKYSKIKIVGKGQTYKAIAKNNYVNCVEIGSVDKSKSQYLIQIDPETFRCKTPLQVNMFTLDNAKFWYLTFYYKFIAKCIDTERIHFTHGDTDSMYFAVSGRSNKGADQQFEYVVRDREYYNANVYKFLPNPNITDKIERIRDEKKILGCAIEKYGDNEISLCPKVYTIWDGIIEDNTAKTKALKVKGVSLKTNHLTTSNYKEILDLGIIKVGENRNLQMKINKGKAQMSRITVTKNALTGFNNKMITLVNQSCAPYINGVKASDWKITKISQL